MTNYLYDIAGSYQSGFSVATAKREGYLGGVCKLTEGLTRDTAWDKINKAWARNWYGSSGQYGAVWGGYHYLRKGNGAAQARYFLDEFNSITGHGVVGHLVQLDNESDADFQTTLDWCNEFKRLTNNHPFLMYTGSWWWNVTGRKWNGLSLTPNLWHSHYVAGEGIASILYESVSDAMWNPGYGNWPRASILQFSSKGSAGGLVNNVDVNAFNGSIADFQVLLGGITQPVSFGGDMLIAVSDTGQYYLCDGLYSRSIANNVVGDLIYLSNQGLVTIGSGTPGAEWDTTGKIRKGWTEAIFGAVISPSQGVDLNALADNIIGKLAPALAVALEQAFALALQKGSES